VPRAPTPAKPVNNIQHGFAWLERSFDIRAEGLALGNRPHPHRLVEGRERARPGLVVA
jgi:hypothetical protein